VCSVMSVECVECVFCGLIEVEWVLSALNGEEC